LTDPWAQSVEQRLALLETRKAVEEVHHGNLAARLSAIEDTLKWIVRLVLSGVVLAVLALVLKGGGIP